MLSGDFKIGDLVWATMARYPAWPGEIVPPPVNEQGKEGKHCVYFFGSKNHAWISSKNILHHTEQFIPPNYEKKKSRKFVEAIEEIKKRSRGDEIEMEDNADGIESPDVEIVEQPAENITKTTRKKIRKVINCKRKKQVNSKGRKRGREPENEKVKNGKEYSLSNLSETAEVSENGEGASCSKIPKIAYDVRSAGCSSSDQSFVFNSAANGNSMPRKETSPVAENKSQGRSDIKFDPPERIGFLGLGNMGIEIAKNLIMSGHYVTVWNKTEAKCEECVEAGAVKAASPAEVVKASDIIFSCVSDAVAVNTILFGDDGVLKGFQDCSLEKDDFKGFVELSSIDYETSQAAADAIISKSGRYLEAPIIGTKGLAETGSLFILAAGDLHLFYACETFFRSFAVHSYYVSHDVGDGAKYNITLNMVIGTSFASLIETLYFANRMNVDMDLFFKTLVTEGCMSETFIEKGKAFLKRDFSNINVTLKHLKKVLSLSLNLGNSYIQPMSVTAAANNFLKSSFFWKCANPSNGVAHQD